MEWNAMQLIGKKIAGLSLRIWMCIAVMAGSYFVIHGIMNYLQDGSGVVESVAGAVICVSSMVIGAIPSNRRER